MSVDYHFHECLYCDWYCKCYDPSCNADRPDSFYTLVVETCGDCRIKGKN